ncbi:MAG: cyclase [Actinomycetota bacterium]
MAITALVRHAVEDYDTWKPGFDGHEATRRLHGATGHRLMRDGNNVTVLVDFPDRQAADGFIADPSLQDVMTKFGVIGAPEVSFLDPAEEITY